MTNSYVDVLKQELTQRGIYFKETAKDIIVYCPYCLDEGKEKLKLYISKSAPIFHCFRCNRKGLLIYSDLLHRLGLYEFQMYLYQNIDLCDVIRLSHEDIFELIDQLNEINLLELYRKNRLELQITHRDEYLYQRAIAYLQKRNIDIHWLNRQQIKFYIDCDINSRTYGRIVFLTFFGSNYEARTFIQSTIRYLKHMTTVPYPDMVLFLNNGNTIYNYYAEDVTGNFQTLIFTEGVFDALTLAQYGFNCCSLGGKVNVIRSIVFVYILRHLCNITFDKLVYIFDNDVKEDEIREFMNYVSFNFSDTITVEAYKMPQEHKDLNSIQDENTLFTYLQNIKRICNERG